MTRTQISAILRNTILTKMAARDLAGELDPLLSDPEFETIWRSRPLPKTLLQ